MSTENRDSQDEVSRRRFLAAAGAAGTTAGILAWSGATAEAATCGEGSASVLDYEAVGDGVTDDTNAIQAAISDCGGKELFFPGQVFRVTAGLQIPSGITLNLGRATLDFSDAPNGVYGLLGEGTEASSGKAGFAELATNAKPGDSALAVPSGAESAFAPGDLVKVGSNAIFDPGRSDALSGEIGEVLSTGSGTISLRSPLMGGEYRTSDQAFLAKISEIKDITIAGGLLQFGGVGQEARGISLGFANRCRILGTKLSDVENTAIRVLSVLNSTIDGVDIQHSNFAGTGYGVIVARAAQGVTVANCHFRDCRHAVTTGGSTAENGVPRRVTCIGNQIYDSASGDAIDTHASGEDIAIIANTVYDAKGQGINVECPNAVLIGNRLWKTTSNAISVHNETPHPGRYLIMGNTIQDADDSGIEVRPGGTAHSAEIWRYLSIVGNTIENAVGPGIYVSSPDARTIPSAVVSNNVVVNCQNLVGQILLVKAPMCAVSGNTVRSNIGSQVGIRISQAPKAAVTGNVVFGNAKSGTGIRLVSTEQATVTGNSVRDEGTGIHFDAETRFCTVLGNNVKGNTTPITLGIGEGNRSTSNVGAASVASVASATTLTLPGSPDDLFKVTGSVEIKRITASDAGREITLLFSGAVNISDGENLKLGSSFGATADDTLTLRCDGVNWYEACRSVN